MKINPDEIKHYIKEHYSKSIGWREGFKNKKNDSFNSRLINYLKRKELKIILNLLKNQNNKKILDAGCGNGEYSLALARKFPQAQIYAIDFSESMCELTQRRAKELKLKNIKVINGDIDNLPFKESYFDTLLCIDTLHHIPNSAINKTLNELNRVTERGGMLVTDFKNRNNFLLYYSHKKKNRLTYFRTNRNLREMKNILKKVNFKVFKARGIGFPMKIIAPYIAIFCEKK